MWQPGKRKKHNIIGPVSNKKGSKGTLRRLLAIFANRNQTFSIHREGTHHKKFAQSCRMSFILRYVPAALATTDVNTGT